MLKALSSRVAGILAFAALAAIPLPAAAQTADGQTPAQETACNGQTGAAYGLCTLYLPKPWTATARPPRRRVRRATRSTATSCD